MEKAPFALLGLQCRAMAFLGVLVDARLQSRSTSMNIVARVLLSVYGVAFYSFASVVPLGLSPLYQFPVTITWLHVAATLGGSVLAVALRRSAPAFTAAWIVYVATLSPVLGIFHNGPQIVADRYSYLASHRLGAPHRRPGGPPMEGRAGCSRRGRGVGSLLLGTLTWQQSQCGRLYRALEPRGGREPGEPGSALQPGPCPRRRGRLAAAIAHWEETRRRSVEHGVL